VGLYQQQNPFFMKNIFTLAVIAAIFTVFISSCGKDTPDLTTNLVGTYYGSFVDISGGVNYDSTGESITVTRIDNQTIQVSPINNAVIPFTATVTATANGYTFSIPQQTTSGGVSLIGNPTYNSNPSVNGSFLSSGSSFASSTNITYNGSVVTQTYIGVKQ
jgi:hypothetical protein